MKNFASIEQRFLKLYAQFHPVQATSLGIRGEDGSYSDFSASSIRSYLASLQEISERLEAQDLSLTQKQQVECELLKNKILLEQKEYRTFQTHRKNPSLYVGEVLYGLWFLLVRPFPKKERVQWLCERLRKIPEVFEQAKHRLEHPPKLWTKIAQHETEGLLSFLDECQQELARSGSARKGASDELFQKARDASRSFQKFLRTECLKRSDGEFAIGERNFNFLLKTYHGYSESAKELVRIGEQSLEAVEGELCAVAEQIQKGTSWQKLIKSIQERHPSSKDLLKAYQKQVQQLKLFITRRQIVSIPPQERLRIIETPVFARSTIPYAAYIDPPLFGEDRTGTFFVTPVPATAGSAREGYLREHNYASLAVTSLHEGYPGHHLQFVYQANLKSPIRRLFNCSSYYEGWALYCEEMMGEQGFYTPEFQLIQLKDKLWRACRILVDVGIQTRTMTDDEAVKFLVNKAHLSRPAARADVNWYTQSPTIPQSYFTGMLKIKALREEKKKAWGKQFALRKFHEWFLNQGAIPIGLIR